MQGRLMNARGIYIDLRLERSHIGPSYCTDASIADFDHNLLGMAVPSKLLAIARSSYVAHEQAWKFRRIFDAYRLLTLAARVTTWIGSKGVVKDDDFC
jgi:hypothetical protein